MLGQLFAIARNTFLESIRQPIVFVLVIAGSLLQVFNLALSAYSLGYTEETEVHGDDKLLLDMGLATVLVAATLLAAFIATSVLSREIENKTALTVISKPVGRPLFVLGKYLGVAAAMTIAVVTMLAFFQLAIRHEVMSTARDTLDGPVVLFGGLAVVISLLVAVWGNFFYGWVFASTATGLLAPLALLAWGATLFVSKEWALQAPTTDLKPQILLASAGVLLAMLVLTAIAIACSTRLGQVMTVVVCAGIFVLGLLSNHLLGRYAVQNQQFAVVDEVLVEFEDDTLDEPGDSVRLVLGGQPRIDLSPGDPIWFGPAPSGIRLAVPHDQNFTGDPDDGTDLRDPALGRGLVVQAYDAEERELTLVNAGGLAVHRMPRAGEFLFAQPTRYQPAAFAGWVVVPNIQSFWLVDAVTQGHGIPGRYMRLIGLYTLTQIVAILALAIALFQTRDVG